MAEIRSGLSAKRLLSLHTALLVLFCAAATPVAGAPDMAAKKAARDFPAERSKIIVTSTVKSFINLRVPMRDGTELATHVFLPDSEGPFPVLLVRTPYDARGYLKSDEWPGRGYAYVAQDVRGCFLSDGDFYPWFNEMADGEDTLNWIAAQPWCNGNIAMYGGSYVAATQLAASVTGRPALKCFTPCLIGSEYYHTSYWGGAFRLGWQSGWVLKPKEGADRDEIKRHLPLVDADLLAAGRENKYWRDALNHPQYDGFWKPMSMAEHFGKVQTPAFIRTGWFDTFVCDVFDLYNGLRKHGGSEDGRKYTRVIVGPWPHNINQQLVGEEDFGPAAAIEDLYEQEIAFIDQFTRGKPGYDLNAAPIRIFVMGTNKWRDEYEWPLARTVWTDSFLSSGGKANTALGDGALSSAPSGPGDSFNYDPSNPSPTKGGAWDSTCGPCDQRETEKRQDVLVYTANELPNDLEVTGPIVVRLFAASSAVDTDFTAKLVDLRPDGRAMSVTDGIIRARYRNLNGREEFLTPGKVYEFIIECNPTSYAFLKGHRMRLEISSSNFPAFARNLNTGNDTATDAKVNEARQTIFHSKEYPSRIILPVIRERR
jgi:uncharacterized protein